MDSTQSRIQCDVQGCSGSFTRQQDLHRHQREYHCESKKCPWCDYTSKRDQRVLEHIDENHRPRKHKMRLSTDSPKQTQDSEEFRSRDRDETANSSSVQAQSLLDESALRLGEMLQPLGKRGSPSFEDLPILSPQPTAASSLQRKTMLVPGREAGDDKRKTRGLSVRSRPTVGSESILGAQMMKNGRDSSIKYEQNSTQISASTNYSPSSMSNDMSNSQHFSQVAQHHPLQAFQSSQPRVQFEPTPLSSSSYTSQASFYYGFQMGTPQALQPSYTPSPTSPAFNGHLLPVSSPDPSYVTTAMHQPSSSLLSPYHSVLPISPTFIPSPTSPSVATHYDDEFMFPPDEEYDTISRTNRW